MERGRSRRRPSGPYPGLRCRSSGDASVSTQPRTVHSVALGAGGMRTGEYRGDDPVPVAVTAHGAAPARVDHAARGSPPNRHNLTVVAWFQRAWQVRPALPA